MVTYLPAGETKDATEKHLLLCPTLALQRMLPDVPGIGSNHKMPKDRQRSTDAARDNEAEYRAIRAHALRHIPQNITAISTTLCPPLSSLRSQRRVADEMNRLTPFGCGREAV
jgi:hypothetical protein